MDRRLWILGGATILLGIIIAGCTEPTGSQTQPASQGINSSCPERGFLESDTDYCIDLCRVGKEGKATNCRSYCEQFEDVDYQYGTEHLAKTIEKFKCSKCGDC